MFRVPSFSLSLLVALIILVLSVPDTRAARPLETGSIETSTAAGELELVVLEVESCLYCALFRRDVLPRYQASSRAKSVPLRFLDLNDKAADDLALDGPVMVVPTVVLMRRNKEVGRVPGYVGPENFFHAVNHLLAGNE